MTTSDLFMDPRYRNGPSPAWFILPGLLLVAIYALGTFGVFTLDSALANARLPMNAAMVFYLGLGLAIGGIVVAALRNLLRPRMGHVVSTTSRVPEIRAEKFIRDLQEEELKDLNAHKEALAAKKREEEGTMSEETPRAPAPPSIASSIEPGGNSVGADDAPSETQEPVPPTLENEIKQLNRQISRATVKYGLGELSREGYVKYTTKLRERKSHLETKLEEQKGDPMDDEIG